MAYSIKQTFPAESDLYNAMDYMSYTLDNHQASTNFFNRYNEKLELLSENPYMYEKIKIEHLKDTQIRVMPVDNYLAFYRVVEEKKSIIILRLFYQRQNYKKYLCL